ncbi:alpha/beta fold hydrolase [Pelomyxa schiedti]|nr:alpha/beta fold hydrolase [Pelomyxa schiedti]
MVSWSRCGVVFATCVVVLGPLAVFVWARSRASLSLKDAVLSPVATDDYEQCDWRSGLNSFSLRFSPAGDPFVVETPSSQAVAASGTHPINVRVKHVQNQPVQPNYGSLAKYTAAGAVECDLSRRAVPGLLCLDVVVPVDHFAQSDSGNIMVHFQILPASKRDGSLVGPLVFNLGGPGVVAHNSLTEWILEMPVPVREAFDLVFFDQRGVGDSCGLWCLEDSTEFYKYDMNLDDDTGRAETVNRTYQFATDCVHHLNSFVEAQCVIGSNETPAQQRRSLLPFLGTQQAIRDLEVFRVLTNTSKLWLYGASYGTYFMQAYASSFPESVASIILDCSVNPALNISSYTSSQVRGLQAVIRDTLSACERDPSCNHDAACSGSSCTSLFDKLNSQLQESYAVVDFPLPTSTPPFPQNPIRYFSDTALQTVSEDLLYSPHGRSQLLRALLQASVHRNFLSLLRLFYLSAGVDSLTLGVQSTEEQEDFSDASYLAICGCDYSFDVLNKGGDDVQLWVSDYVEQGSQYWTSPFGVMWFIDIAEAFVHAETHSPVPSNEPMPLPSNVPCLLITSDVDPSTPFEQSLQLHGDIPESSLLVLKGGPHVGFLSGSKCVDSIVTDFLFGEEPESETTYCEISVFPEYVPLTPSDSRLFSGPLDALIAADIELHNLPEYVYWKREKNLAVGCHYGGIIRFINPSSVRGRLHMRLEDCEFSKGLILSGNGTEDYKPNYKVQKFTLSVQTTGSGWGGIFYERLEDTPPHVHGTWQTSSDNTSIVSGILFIGSCATVLVVVVCWLKFVDRTTASHKHKSLREVPVYADFVDYPSL